MLILSSRSVVSRTVQSSFWPNILRTDAVSSRKVPLRVFILTWLITLSVILLTIAGVVTPLGLRQELTANKAARAHFEYSPDKTGYGFGTAPRYNRFTRLCGGLLLRNCPGRFDGFEYVRNSTGVYGIDTTEDAYFNTTILANLTEIFTSATSHEGSTISGAFDIQHRTWAVKVDDHKLVDRGNPYPVGKFRSLESLILRNDVILVEGLVVDARNGGGVGFRNHSVPVGATNGAEWKEDLLWVKPVTSCVNTNLTFLIHATDQTNLSVSLIDNGGTYLLYFILLS
jgi:hypothetical protein